MFQRNTQDTGRSSFTKFLPVVFLSYVFLAFAHFIVTACFDVPILIGDRSEAVFDMWSIQHVLAGMLLGSIFARVRALRLWREKIAAIIFLEIFWEVIELSMEIGCFGQTVAHWKNGFEHWSNRLVGDMLTVLVGVWIAKRFSNIWKIVLIPAAMWLLLNVSFSDSMYVQRALFRQSHEGR